MKRKINVSLPLAILCAHAFFFTASAALSAEETQGNIEIYVGGKKYNSIDEYKRYKIEEALKKNQEKEAAEKSANTDLSNLAEEIGKAIAALPGSENLSERIPSADEKTQKSPKIQKQPQAPH